MLKEETMKIKKCLDPKKSHFTASNGWLQKWKFSYGARERKVNGEAGEVSKYTVSALMERLLELKREYELADIWNMDETGCFFKTLPKKGLAGKKSQAAGGKKPKAKLTAAFFINTAGEKVIEPLIIRRSAKPRCFRNVKNHEHLHGIYHHTLPKTVDDN